MNRYANYIFDLYGTLVDIKTDETLPGLWDALALVMSDCGAFSRTGDEMREAYLRLCAKEQAKAADPLYEIELRRVFAGLYAENGVEADNNLIDETAYFFRAASTIKLRLYPWVLPVFERIRRGGSRIFLLSNAQACFTLPELEKLGISDAFDGIAISSDAGFRKPDRRIMQGLIDRFGIDPAASLMTGNDRTTDVEIANRFGMDSLYLRTETSFEIPGAPRATFELTDGDLTGLEGLMGIE
ncbi:MAG: HAD family hydrolase [Clostridiales bacterium]|nr:HAD family hydrolase [Clostridiales bacterium]